MKKIRNLILFILLSFSLSSCLELIEDTSFNKDGSGRYKFTLNLSASKTKVNSLMALDSIDGKEVPSRLELQNKLAHYSKTLANKKGISNVKADLNTEHWILHLNLDFQSLSDLCNGIIALTEEIYQKEVNKNIKNISLTYIDNVYHRNIGSFVPIDWQNKIRTNENYTDLKNGKCVFIQRFPQTITKVSAKEIRISKNKKAAMLQLSPFAIVNQPEKLDYNIETKPIRD